MRPKVPQIPRRQCLACRRSILSHPWPASCWAVSPRSAIDSQNKDTAKSVRHSTCWLPAKRPAWNPRNLRVFWQTGRPPDGRLIAEARRERGCTRSRKECEVARPLRPRRGGMAHGYSISGVFGLATLSSRVASRGLFERLHPGRGAGDAVERLPSELLRG